MKAEDEEAFREFVAVQMPVLRRLAYVTCGDWHAAEDATATALAKLYPRWRRLERPDLYARTMVVRAAIDEKRRPWRREHSAGDGLPDVTQRDPATGVDDRLRVWAALRAISPRQRAAVVCRHYLGMSLEETARVLGWHIGTAKSQTSRGLSRLREVLTADQRDDTTKPEREKTSARA
ncbi:SigE family RNA polymerase sigma factor [Micromonospora krabiensis]|uniref:RNA polymerase sigma-70 factor, sigma-E family n=1 Tax=Micromonospora krabiensis TaxID=307121 RepID=A0A1C3N560_9ACTN|nr:SigE family RNA polymerase sigma factor [Micromonospora krabiensis]SBV27714.1 RNA polymerase sigma-70 factor, sigma-E family [Micromonospora krabiensis]